MISILGVRTTMSHYVGSCAQTTRQQRDSARAATIPYLHIIPWCIHAYTACCRRFTIHQLLANNLVDMSQKNLGTKRVTSLPRTHQNPDFRFFSCCQMFHNSKTSPSTAVPQLPLCQLVENPYHGRRCNPGNTRRRSCRTHASLPAILSRADRSDRENI